jgi:hypothetical protein
MEHTDIVQHVWIFIKENDQWHHKPLFLALLDLLQRGCVRCRWSTPTAVCSGSSPTATC